MQNNLKLKNKNGLANQDSFLFKNVIDLYRKKNRVINRNLRSNRFRTVRNLRKKRFLSQFKVGLVGRPYKIYKFFLSKNYLYFSLLVRPNNVFATLKGVSFENNSIQGTINKNYENIKQKKSSDYGIKFTKKGIKSKVLAFLKKFVSSLRYLRVQKYSFIVVDITTPKAIRKKVINLISKSFLSKKFRNKRIVFNVRHQKVFNGCRPRKQVRKKRKKFRLFK
ncbi:MAG TPA: hypothetical protein PLC61_06190 [Chitinophagales bacterium]|nr:hypothetical protein [Chitinophagales bacterium]